MTNVHYLDRLARLTVGVILFQFAFFWLAGVAQWVVYALTVVMGLTATSGFCPLYKIVAPYTYKATAINRLGVSIALVAIILLFGVGSYANNFVSKKWFLDDYNAMNHFYKQTLFETGQGHRELAIENYDQLLTSYKAFQDKYSSYQPYALQGDSQFQPDLTQVNQIIANVNDNVRTGDLHAAHLDLEEVRPVFQGILSRNNFSMLAVTLVDFHDTMELILDAASAKSPEEVIKIYPDVDTKLKAVEAQLNDSEIQTIRQNLDTLLNLAKDGDVDKMPAKGGELKASFVRVYLKRG